MKGVRITLVKRNQHEPGDGSFTYTPPLRYVLNGLGEYEHARAHSAQTPKDPNTTHPNAPALTLPTERTITLPFAARRPHSALTTLQWLDEIPT